MDKDTKVWLSKIDNAKADSSDLSRDEDLSIAVMNLISLEEHFYFTAIKTGKQKYFDMLDNIRKQRIEAMKRLVRTPEGEEWCISKHLLAASMRLYEVGTKELSKRNNDSANYYFESAFELFSMFFMLNMKTGMAKEEKAIEMKRPSKFSEIVKKVVDCCREW